MICIIRVAANPLARLIKRIYEVDPLACPKRGGSMRIFAGSSLNASGFQAATIIGPAAGGILYTLGADDVYFAAAVSVAMGCILALFIKVARR